MYFMGSETDVSEWEVLHYYLSSFLIKKACYILPALTVEQ